MSGRGIPVPPRLPSDFWSRQDVLGALSARDFGVLFRLVSRYAGASQTQIAIAVGMTQSQVSAIMAGDRRITAIDVFERAMDGLGAFDSARVALGLAPRSWSVSTSAGARSPVPRPRPADRVGRDADPTTDDGVNRRDVLRLGGIAALGAVVTSGDATAERVARIARALTSYGPWTPLAPIKAPISLATVADAVASAKRNYQACRYTIVLDALPMVLDSVRLLCESVSGDELLTAYGLAADAYQVTGSVLLKLGDQGLAARAADRSVEAAALSQDPVMLAASARIVTHSLLAGGHAGRATEIASLAAERMAADVRQPDANGLSVYGALLLRGAVAAARCEDGRGEALRLLDEAGEAARRLGRDDNARWTAFGPTNVELHRVNVALVLGDAGTAVELARRVDIGQIPIAERKAVLFMDTAEAYAQWGKYEQAWHAVRLADQVAPEEVRTRRSTPRLLGDMASRAPRSVQAEVREFANLIGAEL